MAVILQNMPKFLLSLKFADFTVKCEDFQWKVHRIILASGSKYFEKACGGRFKEAADKVIILHEDEPEMVARMLLCLYTSNYPTKFDERQFSGCPTMEEFMKKGCPKFRTDKFEHDTNRFLVHSKMYAIADKYDMPGLLEISIKKFDVSTCSDDTVDLVNALPHIYNSTPPTRAALREKTVALVRRYRNIIMRTPELKTKLETACVQNGQLGWDVLSSLWSGE